MAAVERDIRLFPMGRHTILGDATADLAGGQAQRIRFAAALARIPRILIRDGAASWLDSARPERVMRVVESLDAKCVVIAHRLDAVRSAYWIYVLDNGTVAQEGTLDDLMGQEGVFRSLMSRHL